MIFFVRKRDDSGVQIETYPCVLLYRDSWDDYGYKTSFNAYFYEDIDSNAFELGRVKIMHDDQGLGYTQLQESFSSLDSSYCSLGQSVNYYNNLKQLGRQKYDMILKCLRDVTISDTVYARFNKKDIFENSLLRVSSANKALAEAKFILHQTLDVPPAENRKDFSFDFTCQIGKAKEPHYIDFNFPALEQLPSRINVIIGKNGTGKTNLLSNLAISLSGMGTRDEVVGNRVGEVRNRSNFFSNVIVVSYNPFDTFKLPGDLGGKERNSKEGSLFGYQYCGIRDTFKVDGKNIYKIKTDSEIKKSINSAIRRLGSDSLVYPVEDFIWPILEDFSSIKKDISEIVNNFESLGSGQKLSLSILLEIAANIKPESLILIDEPENLLHPSLLSRFIFSIRNILDATNSCSILATHSPVVLQEIPARFVRILSRYGDKPKVSELKIESFGEELGAITQEVFEFTNDMTDYRSVLVKLFNDGFTIDQVEELFGRRIGFSAKSFFESLRGWGE